MSPSEHPVLTFDVYDGTARTASYDLASIESARWTDANEDYAYLELRLRNGEARRHKVMKKAAINVCERVGS